MKNAAFAIAVVCLLVGCSSTKDTTTGPTPPATVVVPPEGSSGQTQEKPTEVATDSAPMEPETPPVDEPRPAGRLAFQQCAEESRKVKDCTKVASPVCGEVDTGIRCVRAPCPSTAPMTFTNACSACVNPKVRGFWPMSCEDMNKPTAP